MAEFNYRFSITPARAVTDKDLSHAAFRVLSLLGRHTNDDGWCRRSQKKMAAELGIGRATVYDALQLLYDKGYVDRRANGRGSRMPKEGEHPFSSYSYRVLLDRDGLPGRIKDAIGDDGGDGEGAGISAGGAGISAGGAGIAAPLEGISSEGISSKPERESARAREEISVDRFLQKWPTAAVDDITRITKAWQGLSGDQQHAALKGIDAFLAKMKSESRTKMIAGWKYLEEKRWTLIAAPKKQDENDAVKTWSKEWWACLFHRIASGQPVAFMVQYAVQGTGRSWLQEHQVPESFMNLTAYPCDGPEMAAWRPWFEDRRIRFPNWTGQGFWVFLPGPTPESFISKTQPLAKTG